MVHFGGVMFFEMDDCYGEVNGIAAKSLTFAIADPNHIFNNVLNTKGYPAYPQFRIKVLNINEKHITNLEELIAIIPTLITKKYFTMDYINFSPFYDFNDISYVGYRQLKAKIEYYANIAEPRLFTFDTDTMQWKNKKLSVI